MGLGKMTRNKDYVKVFIFERTISGHLRRVDCYPQRFRFYLFEEDRFDVGFTSGLTMQFLSGLTSAR